MTGARQTRDRSRHGPNGEAGFTLIELLVVIYVIAIGVALVIPAMTGFRGDSAEYTGVLANPDRVQLKVDSHWTMDGQLPAGTGIAPGSKLGLGLGLSNQPDPFVEDIPIDVPPCPGDPCPVFALSGDYDAMIDLDPATFDSDRPIEVAMQAAIDLRPLTASDLTPTALVEPQELVSDFGLLWEGEARLLLTYNVPEPATWLLFGGGIAALSVLLWRRARRAPPT